MKSIVAISLILSVWAKSETEADPAADCDSSDLSNWDIAYVGKSTKFEYFSTCEADKLFIRINMLKISEIKANGDKTSNVETSFASGDNDDWDSVAAVDSTTDANTCGGIAALTNSFASTTKALGLGLNIKTCLFKEPGTVSIDYANGTTLAQAVEKFMVKWDFGLNSFPFENTDNELEVCLEMETRSKSAEKEEKVDDVDKEKKTFLKLGGYMDFTAPQIYSCDGVEKTVVCDYDAKKAGTKVEVCFRFEYCDGAIEYDPFVLYNNNTANTNTISTVISTLILCFFFYFM